MLIKINIFFLLWGKLFRKILFLFILQGIFFFEEIFFSLVWFSLLLEFIFFLVWEKSIFWFYVRVFVLSFL